jgi:hypothetical protein
VIESNKVADGFGFWITSSGITPNSTMENNLYINASKPDGIYSGNAKINYYKSGKLVDSGAVVNYKISLKTSTMSPSPSGNTCQGISCAQGVPAGCRIEGAFTYTCDPALYSKLTCGKLVCDSPKPSPTPNPYPTTPPVAGGPNLNKFTIAYCTGSVVSRIHVQWDAVTGAEFYRVYRWTDTGGTLVEIGATSGIAVNDETVNPGTKYYYAVKAIVKGKEINGNTISAVASKCQYFSNTPVSGGPNFNNSTQAYCVESGSTSRIHLQWNTVANAVTYKVYRNTNQPNSRIQIGETSGIASNDDKVAAGIQYSYTVVATVQQPGKTASYAYGNDVIITALKCP